MVFRVFSSLFWGVKAGGGALLIVPGGLEHCNTMLGVEPMHYSYNG